ncbi:MAG: hypothetical protein Q8Q40_09870 [Methylococcaceae bacterium]|nr:hypothetical protein [Methylococcaceae bacterium]MDP3904270.1 hypothetical protein [Methylococcaceae bacterium]
MPKIDFPASAKRHFQDAKLLEENSRISNAGQLYGFCAECGIKALLISHGYPTDTEGSPAKNPPSGEISIRKHINQLVAIMTQIDASASGRSGAKYLALIPNIGSFVDWSVDHRYYAKHQIPPSLPAWKGAATEMMQMMDMAISDGVLI